LKSTTDDNKTLKDDDGINLVNLIECHKIETLKPNIKIQTRPSRAYTSMTNNPNNDYYPRESDISHNNYESLIITGNNNDSIVKNPQIKKQYVPKNMSIAAKLIKNR